MQKLEIFEHHFWRPFYKIGLTHSFWNINVHTVIYTWFVIGILIILSLLGKYYITKKNSLIGFIYIDAIKTYNKLITQTIGRYSFTHSSFIISLFTFIFVSNIISIIPWIEEPTADVSTTLALGIISFFVRTNFFN